MTSFAERPPGFNPTRVAVDSASPIENGRTFGSRKEKQEAASAPVELKSNRSNFFGHKYLMDWICIRFVFAAFNVSLGVELERGRARALKAQAQTDASTDEAYVQQGFEERSKLD